MTQYQFSVNGSSDTGTLTWNSNGSLASLAISDALNSSNSQTCGYAHDDLSRIASVSCGSTWGQTFSFDPFGNIGKSGSISFAGSYSTSTNRLTNMSSTYDSNGNLTGISSDATYSYSWDAEGKPVSITRTGSTVNLTYDALGRMVEQNRGGSYTQIVYSPGGAKLALMNGSTLQKASVPLPAGALAVYNGSGLAYYRHADWLGTSRLASTPSRTVYYDGAYAPYGESYSETGTADRDFTGQNQDTHSGLYDFMYRGYHPVSGRWVSPDPAGLAAVDPSNPQSLNRYAYVGNEPINYIDSYGLNRYADPDGHSSGGFGANFGTTCRIEGWFEVPCGTVAAGLDYGSYAQCPDNDCNGVRYNSEGLFKQVPNPVDRTTGQRVLTLNCPIDGGFDPSRCRWDPNSWKFIAAPDELSAQAKWILGEVGRRGGAAADPRFYLAWTAMAAAPGVVKQIAPQLPVVGRTMYEVGRSIYYDPLTWERMSDFVQGMTPGAFPASWAAVAGAASSSWSNIQDWFKKK